MNQATLTIHWDKTRKSVVMSPNNMTETEVLALLKCSLDIAVNQVLEHSSKSGLVIPSGTFPAVGGS